jgi:hypothetical protein
MVPRGQPPEILDIRHSPYSTPAGLYPGGRPSPARFLLLSVRWNHCGKLDAENGDVENGDEVPTISGDPAASCCYQHRGISVSSLTSKTGPKSTRSLATCGVLLLSLERWRSPGLHLAVIRARWEPGVIVRDLATESGG